MKLEIIKQYLNRIEQSCTSEEDYRDLLHPEIEQTEFPNWLTDRVTVSNWDILFKRMASGKGFLKEQKYDIQHVFESGDTLVSEIIWTATVGTDIGQFQTGQQLKAYFCCVFEFKDGKIFRQRNYDCFERF